MKTHTHTHTHIGAIGNDGVDGADGAAPLQAIIRQNSVGASERHAERAAIQAVEAMTPEQWDAAFARFCREWDAITRGPQRGPDTSIHADEVFP